MKGFGFYYFHYTCKFSTSFTFLFSLSLYLSFCDMCTLLLLLHLVPTWLQPIWVFICFFVETYDMLYTFFSFYFTTHFDMLVSFLSFSLLLLLVVNSIIDSWAWLHYIFCLSSFFMEYKYFHFSHFTCLMMLKF
jgi:hypothetical protein